MKAKIASLVMALLAAGGPAAAAAAHGKPAASQTKPATGQTKPAASQTKPAASETVRHTAARRATPVTNAHAVPPAWAAIPEPDRLAIQADLVWLGNFIGLSAEEFDSHTLDAIKTFQKRNNGAETGTLNAQERSLLTQAAAAPEAAVGWRLIDDGATGARVGLPEKLVPRAGMSRTGSRWSSTLGQIQIETFRLHEASLPVLFEDERRTAQRHVSYSVLNPDSFVIVGEQRLKKFVERAQTNGHEVRGVTVLYDQATEGVMASVAVAISDTFVGFPDPLAEPPGQKRSVEYASGVVVDKRGDIVTIGAVVDQCRSITVPGIGHAERIAIDATNDLALVRVYGARDLVPARLAEDADDRAALTLFGIADPSAQDGGGVTKIAAQLTALGLQPVPRPGFSGAAAINAAGLVAGLVAFKPAIVAAIGPAAPQAALVPATSVRSFLAAQHVVPTGGDGASDRAVVRLICVRR